MMHNDNTSNRIQNNDTIVNIYLLVFQYEYLFVLQFFIIIYLLIYFVRVVFLGHTTTFRMPHFHLLCFVSIIIKLISIGNTYKELSVPVVHKNTSKITYTR